MKGSTRNEALAQWMSVQLRAEKVRVWGQDIIIVPLGSLDVFEADVDVDVDVASFAPVGLSPVPSS